MLDWNLIENIFLFLAGLLTDDARRKERKQPGKRNARRKYKLYVEIFE
jgi:ribosomal protein S9